MIIVICDLKTDHPFASQGIVAMMVQMFYAWRIYVLTKNSWITAAVIATSIVGGCELQVVSRICCLTLTSLILVVCGIGTAIAVAMRPDFAGFHHLKVQIYLLTSTYNNLTYMDAFYQTVVIIWLVGSAVCDVMITIVLSWHLVCKLHATT